MMLQYHLKINVEIDCYEYLQSHWGLYYTHLVKITQIISICYKFIIKSSVVKWMIIFYLTQRFYTTRDFTMKNFKLFHISTPTGIMHCDSP